MKISFAILIAVSRNVQLFSENRYSSIYKLIIYHTDNESIELKEMQEMCESNHCEVRFRNFRVFMCELNNVEGENDGETFLQRIKISESGLVFNNSRWKKIENNPESLKRLAT